MSGPWRGGFAATALVLAGAVVVPPPAGATAPFLAERVFVETPGDTDGDGRRDRVAIDINRPAGGGRVPAVVELTPYGGGGGGAVKHNVDVPRLPQEAAGARGTAPGRPTPIRRGTLRGFLFDALLADGYATISGKSLGANPSQGCPSTGGRDEALAAAAVVDWLNGRVKGYTAASGGGEVRADWATGKVGMTGASYDGTLANMAAATGVEGLAAIVPIAAISDWYDYYRANGLVVAPGGYQGEDADVLARGVARKGACAAALDRLTATQGREHGDYTQFWRDRAYSDQAGKVRAAVLIGHGMGDWNVRGTQYARWYEGLASAGVPRKLVLHRGGHTFPNHPQWRTTVSRWWDRWLKGVDNGVDREPRADVDVDGTWRKFADWPDPAAQPVTYRLGAADATRPGTLTTGTPAATAAQGFVDGGRGAKVAALIADGNAARAGRLVYVTAPLAGNRRLSGAARVTLRVATENRTAANLTVALVAYDSGGGATLLSRGWADPQNAAGLAEGRPLTPGTPVTVTFDLEPQDRLVGAGRRLGLVVLSTDSDYTLRPPGGAALRVEPAGSSLTVRLADA